MTEQGYMIINGQKVEGRTLSFDTEGIKIGEGKDAKVVIPNEFDFKEETKTNKNDFIGYETSMGKISINNKIYKKSNKKLFIAIGTILCTGIVIGGIICKNFQSKNN